MVTAGEIMTKDVFTISPEAPILEAVRLLSEHSVSGLPVVDKENTLKGIITEKDVLKLLVDSDNPELRFVDDLMTKKVTSFKESESILDICRFFMKSTIRRVPITSEDEKLIGVVSRRDLLNEIKRIKSI